MISSQWLRQARRVGLIACLVAALGFVAGCGGGDNGGSSGGGEAKLLKIGTANEVDSLNPLVGVSILATEFSHQMYPFLTQYDQNANLGGAYAKSWKFSNGFKTLTFQLTPGGKWSDGKPLTAKDAAFTLQTIVKYAKGPTAYAYGAVPTLKGATAPDDNTLVIQYTAPSPQAPSQLSFIPILPEHVWSQYATGDGKGLQTFQNKAPVVSGGPFTLQAYAPKQFAKFVRNDDFYGSKPHVQQIGYTIFSSPDALVKAIQSGEIDAAEQASPSSLSALRQAGLNIQDPVSFSELWLMINDSSGKTPPLHPELHNAKVRKAFDMAIDRDRVVKTAYFGQGEPGSSLIPPSAGKYHLDQPVTTFDIDGANALLDEAGYKRGADGTRVADGHPMSYKLVEFKLSGGAEDPAAQIIKSDFAKLGVKVDIQVLDVAAAIGALMDKDYSTFDLSVVTFVGSYDPANVLNSLRCASLTSFNPNGHCDKKYDDLFLKLGQLPEGQARVDVAHQLQQMMADDGSLLTLAYSKDIYAYRDGWTGFEPSPSGWFFGTGTATSVGKAS